MEIYHERQRLQFCLLHALNNLFQGHDKFTKQTLDSIADSLEAETAKQNPPAATILRSFSKHHRNVFTGNYDVNVLLAALTSRGLQARWHDKRKPVCDSDLTRSDLTGLIVNTTNRRYLSLWKSRHWIALRPLHGRWFNLDSDLQSPVAMEDVQELKAFLDHLLERGGELFVVTTIPSPAPKSDETENED